MPEMISYIFGSLRTSEKAIRNIETALRHQSRINRSLSRNLTIVTLTMGTYIAIQNKKIEKLSREIKELKRAEGE